MSRVLPALRGWRVLVAVFLISLPAVTTRLYASDEIQYFAYLRSLWFDQDVSFQNEYEYFYDRGIARGHGFHETFLELETPTGLRLNFGTIGSALLWAPFYGVGDIVARVGRLAGSSMPVDGFSPPYIAAVTYGSAVYGFLAVVLSILAVRRLIGDDGRAAAVVWVGTPLLFYMYVAPGMAHACSAFVVSAFVLTWLHVRVTWSKRGLVALGALAALMVMVREQDVLYVIGPVVDYLWSALERAKGAEHPAAVVRAYASSALLGVLTALATYVPQAAAYVALNGRLGPPDVVAGKMVWSAPYALQVMLSPQHGFFVWTPLAPVALLGVGLLVFRHGSPDREWQELRRIGTALLLMVAGQVYVSGSIEGWTVAGAFGQRRFVGLTVILVIGLSALLRAVGSRPHRRALWATIALCVWWNLALMVQFGTGTMDRQQLVLSENFYNAFVVVPGQLPRIVYRYLFDRQSFYASPAP